MKTYLVVTNLTKEYEVKATSKEEACSIVENHSRFYDAIVNESVLNEQVSFIVSEEDIDLMDAITEDCEE